MFPKSMSDYKFSTLNLIPPLKPLLAMEKNNLSSSVVSSLLTNLNFLTEWIIAIFRVCKAYLIPGNKEKIKC